MWANFRLRWSVVSTLSGGSFHYCRPCGQPIPAADCRSRAQFRLRSNLLCFDEETSGGSEHAVTRCRSDYTQRPTRTAGSELLKQPIVESNAACCLSGRGLRSAWTARSRQLSESSYDATSRRHRHDAASRAELQLSVSPRCIGKRAILPDVADVAWKSSSRSNIIERR